MHFQKTQRLKVSSNIYSRRNGQIIVLGGGHGHSTGGNWFPIENSSDMAYKYPDEVILNELTRGIGLIDEDLDAPRITLLNLGQLTMGEINAIINERQSKHVIFSFCDSVNDQLFIGHLQKYRKNPPQN